MTRRHTSGEYEFCLNCPSAREVVLVGDFHRCPARRPERPSEVAMARSPSGDWRCRVMLSAGVYEFRYRVDGNWCLDGDGASTPAAAFLTSSLVVRDEEIPAEAYVG